ncbi:hypothetical protein RLOC_00007815 [Lonchura striata]|uniref:Uncharacterized protein n=1 Tax=Lonchura striata TaxID=40157 RepID=A0A218UMI2_9PASE|nr:hypothetical protein RLOC_00007815 [Lonchura striata domestica]
MESIRGATPRREGCSSPRAASKMRDAGIPVAGLFLASALSFHLLYWRVSRETSVAVLGVYGRRKGFFQAGVLCVCSNAFSRTGGARSCSVLFMKARALHAVAELLQPCSQRSSSCLHRAVPTMAAAGS